MEVSSFSPTHAGRVQSSEAKKIPANINNEIFESGSISNEDDPSNLSLECLLDQDLDSILNSKSESGINPFIDVSDAMSITSRTSGSAVSQASVPNSTSSIRKLKKKGSILRHVILKNITSHLTSGFSRIGAPTSIAVSAWLAVGSNSGLTFVFDGGQNLRWCLGAGTGRDIESFGSVSALSFNADCTRLLCGHVRGHIVMYDVSNGKLLRILEDAHKEETTVINIKFTNNPTVAVFSDITGNVYEVNFKRTFGVRGHTTTCLYDGVKGPAVTLEPLNQAATETVNRIDDIILAFATLDKVMIVKIKPQRKVVFCQKLSGDERSLPLLAWQYLTIQTSNGRIVDPVLACARSKSISFFQLSRVKNGSYSVVPLMTASVPYSLTSVGWVDNRTLVTFDVKERLHLFDVKDQEEIEELDLSGVGIVYSSGTFKGLATGFDVHRSLAIAGEFACFQSIVVSCGQVFVLGTRSVHAVILRKWQERIDYLVKQKRHVEALSFGSQLLEERAKSISVKMDEEKRTHIKEKMKSVLEDFIAVCILPCRNDDIAVWNCGADQLSGCIANSVKLQLGAFACDLIYSSTIETPILKATFLESLENLILDDKLKEINPAIVKDFVFHYESKGRLKVLESCLLHLDIACLDFNQVIGICTKKSLYTALLYLHNKALDDFVGPLEDLFGTLIIQLDSEGSTEKAIEVANIVLVYVSCCLNGQAFPYGLMPDEKAHRVSHEVLLFLTSLHSKKSVDTEKSYPYLRTLLRINTREFLNVLSMAFEESPLKSSDVGQRQRQRIVDILIGIMVQSDGAFDSLQVGALFTFITRQLAIPPLSLDDQLLLEILEFITQPDTGERHEEKQQALIELLHVKTIDVSKTVGPGKLLSMAERAGFYRVSEQLYRAEKQYDSVFRCLVSDLSRRHLALPYMKSVLTQENSSWQPKMVSALMENLEAVLESCMGELIEFLIKFNYDLIQKVMDNLASNDVTRYEFMGKLLETSSEFASCSSASEPGQLFSRKFHLEYVSLMAQCDKQKILAYVSNCSEDILGPEILQVCSSAGLKAAEVIVLERLGEVEKAFERYLSSMADSLAQVRECNDSLDECSSNAAMIVEFCERNPHQKFWLQLLDLFLDIRRKFGINKGLADISHYLLSTVQAYLPPNVILQRVLSDSSDSKATWKDVKQLTTSMLDSYNYETTLYDIVTRMFRLDTHRQFEKFKKRTTKAIVVSEFNCCICSNFTTFSKTELDAFRCGHVCHARCFPEHSESAAEIRCPICSQQEEKHETLHLVLRQNHVPSHS
ncbi:vacuolar protein sorting-associated protein 8 homolog isoform X2 [Artemia franciscana]|uniref:RING-type domain-containing protein n=1 Tax=Artemia franciscana TaxID=6661 RepID=A0AA88KZ96_ARTSF|nr:hypothetical protein QYM36_019533 [Artemia franciscana]